MTSRKLNIVTVEPVLFLYMFGTFLIMPIIQQLAFKKLCYQVYNETFCDDKNFSSFKYENDNIQRQTSAFSLHQSIALTIPSVLASLWLGSISDKVGRKFIMILPPLGSLLQGVGFIINTVYFSLSVNYLIIGICLSGFFGGFATILVSVFAYMADITEKGNRTKRMGVLESMVFVGATFGFLIGGVMVEKLGFNSVFILYLVLVGLQIIYTICIVRESYFPEQNISLVKAAFNVNRIKELALVFIKPRTPQRNRAFLCLLLFSFFILVGITSATGVITVLFLKTPQLDFSPSLIGYFFAAGQALRGIGLMFGLPLMVRLQFNEYIIGIIGTTSLVLSYVLTGISTKVWMLFLCSVIGVFGATEYSVVRALMSKAVAGNEQGNLFAAIASVESLSTLVASVISVPLYSQTEAWFPGFTFLILAAIGVVFALSVLIVLLIWDRRCQSRYRVMIEEDDGSPSHDAQVSPEPPSEVDSAFLNQSNPKVHVFSVEEAP